VGWWVVVGIRGRGLRQRTMSRPLIPTKVVTKGGFLRPIRWVSSIGLWSFGIRIILVQHITSLDKLSCPL
jgi:hypothetical protein